MAEFLDQLVFDSKSLVNEIFHRSILLDDFVQRGVDVRWLKYVAGALWQ